MKRLKKGGDTFGEGQLGKIIDYKELGKFKSLSFYDIHHNECFRISGDDSITTGFIDRIVFKDFFKQNTNTNTSKAKIKRFVEEKILDQNNLILKEIENMRIVGQLSIKTPLFEYQNYRILFAVMDSSKIMPVYEKYDSDLYKLSNTPTLLTENNVIKFIHSLLQTLLVLHQNELYHFDIKPANILYQKNTNSVVLADYGFLNSTEAINYVEGSPLYQSPFFRMWGFECPQEDKYEECNDIIASYDEMKDYYMQTIMDLTIAYSNCDNDTIKEFIDNCMGHGERSKNVIEKINKRNSQYLGMEFAEKITNALSLLCDSSYQTNAGNTCPNVKHLAKELARIILQKNELYALGTTFAQLIHKLPNTEIKKKLALFIDKMRKARLFVQYETTSQDFYFVEEALDYFRTHFRV
jgi:tRNA A-37 threonylcarbamoyl transferase component Bud32